MNWVNTGQDIDLFHNYAETWTMKYGFTINRTSWNVLRAIISNIKQFESRNIFWNSGLCLLCYLIYSTSFIFERHKRLNLLIKHQGPDIITDILWTKEYTLIAMLDLLYILSIDFMYFNHMISLKMANANCSMIAHLHILASFPDIHRLYILMTI